jgi:hypothetical protein
MIGELGRDRRQVAEQEVPGRGEKLDEGDDACIGAFADDGHCLVDLVIDRAPVVDVEKARFGSIRVDTLREIATNKICALLSRSEVKDRVDLRELLGTGIDLGQVFADVDKKEAAADPATLAWVLDQISIGPAAILPGSVDPTELVAFRDQLTARLRAMAFERVRKS